MLSLQDTSLQFQMIPKKRRTRHGTTVVAIGCIVSSTQNKTRQKGLIPKLGAKVKLHRLWSLVSLTTLSYIMP